MPLRTGLRPPLAGRAGRLEPKLRRVSERGQRHLRDVAGHFVPGEGEEREMGGRRGYSDQRACLDTRNGPGERGSDLRWCRGAGTQAGRDSSSYLPLLPQRRAPGSLFRRLSRTSPSPWGQDSPCGCSGILQPEGESAGSSKPRSAAGDFSFPGETWRGTCSSQAAAIEDRLLHSAQPDPNPEGSGERLSWLPAPQDAQEQLECIKLGGEGSAHSLLCAASSHPSPLDSASGLRLSALGWPSHVPLSIPEWREKRTFPLRTGFCLLTQLATNPALAHDFEKSFIARSSGKEAGTKELQSVSLIEG